MRERETPEVIAYLDAENAYLDRGLGHTKGLQETLFEEIIARIKQDDAAVPYLRDGYYYYARYEEGKEYAIYCRKKGSLNAPEEIIVDANELAEGHDFFSLRGLEVSSERDIVAFGTDTVGRRFYTLRFKNLNSSDADRFRFCWARAF
ncbi:MAG: hypothetical protein E2P02_24620 [Acidobacteria bacterium]|nr:MAG: hypothetical protein E2P02_24620 [Acidobacteriota bacterium]